MAKIKIGKVYREATDYSRELNSLTISNEFIKYAKTIAECLSRLNDTKGHVEYLHEVTKDNGDVEFALKDAICELGVALATCMDYARSYEDEANGVEDQEV